MIPVRSPQKCKEASLFARGDHIKSYDIQNTFKDRP